MPVKADQFQTKLRAALVHAVPVQVARARRRARRQRIAFAIVVGFAVAATIVTFALPDQSADATIDVQQRDGKVYVRLVDLESRPDEIVQALANAGIHAKVDLVPVGPSNVGKFVPGTIVPGTDGPGAGFAVSEGTEDRTFRAFSVNAGFTGELGLGLGRLASPGEDWRTVSNALARGEALACRDFIGKTATEAAAALAHDTNLSIRWFAYSGGQVDNAADPNGAQASWQVIDVASIAPNAVILTLTPDGSWPFLTEPTPPIDPSCKGR